MLELILKAAASAYFVDQFAWNYYQGCFHLPYDLTLTNHFVILKAAASAYFVDQFACNYYQGCFPKYVYIFG